MNRTGDVLRTDVAVIGGGAAGLSAALAAAQFGAQVTLIDNYQQPGGQYFRQPAAEFKAPKLLGHQQEGKALWEEVRATGVTILSQTVVWGAFEGNRLALYGPEATFDLRAQAIILATGAYERVAAFPGWTLPGVITSGAAQTLLKEQHVLPGQRVLLAGTGPLQLVVGAELVRAGAQVVAILEGSRLTTKMLRRPLSHGLALWGQWGRLAEGLGAWWTLRRNGVPYYPGWGVVAARGQEQVTGVTVARLDEAWRPIPDASRALECDTLCVSYGFVPTTELAQLLGVRHRWQPELGGFVPDRDEYLQTNVPGVFAAGDCAGVGGGPLALIEGRIAGLAAANQVKAGGTQHRQEAAIPDGMRKLRSRLRREGRFQQLYSQLFTPGPGLDQLAQADTILCRCEGVTPKEIREAVRQGADTLDAVKALTRCGMGNCQGRVCGPLVAAVVARETGGSRGEVGQFRARPPIFPIPLMALKPSVEDQGGISAKKEGRG